MIFVWLAVITLVVAGGFNLVVGITNDAVNFLHAAIGAKVARRRIIFGIASLGILAGTFISGGMMEAARNGVINPNNFHLNELLAIFSGVLITNILLIDGFNTLKLPTSTTVAIVFELIGGALALTLITTTKTGILSPGISEAINSDRTFLILAGIVISIFVAFITGIVVQFFTRLIFTFHYQNKHKTLSSVIGGITITIITFMIFRKSLSDIFFESAHWQLFIQNYTPEILATIFAGSTFIFLFLGLSFNVDVARMVVFFGTFALALSFTANDLVNFIGIPLGGIESLKQFLVSQPQSPDTFSLDFLNDNLLQRSSYESLAQILIFGSSALILVLTLFYSRKVRGVTNTEVYLERQQTGQEHFEPSFISRMISRTFFDTHNTLVYSIPKPIRSFINKRFELPKQSSTDSFTNEAKASFDTLRAVVNLMAASFLISLGTYLKLPLSTTFVVFMVAMGTSMADRAWTRDNAIYRISGVLSILGGWFFTATLAFLGGFIFTLLIWYGRSWSLLILWPIVIIALNKSRQFYKKREQSEMQDPEVMSHVQTSSIEWVLESVGNHIRSLLMEASKIYYLSIQAFIDENMVQLHESKNKAEELIASTHTMKSELFVVYSKLPDSRLETSHYFIQCLDYLTELASSIHKVALPIYAHLENAYKGLTPSQNTDLKELLEQTTSYFNFFIHLEKEERFELVPDMIKKQEFLLSFIESLRFEQLKKIKDGEGKNRGNILYMEVLAETKNWLLYSINLLKSHRDFVSHCQ